MRSTPRQLITVCLASALCLPPAWAADATLSGRVFGGDGSTPRAAVGVHLVQGEGEEVFSSTTGADGAFAIDAPAGSYTLLVDTPSGAFVHGQPLVVQAGVNPPLALSLLAAADASGLGSSTSTGLAPWAKWLIVGVLGLSGLYIASEVVESEDPSSEF
jgi:hypothetical protein